LYKNLTFTNEDVVRKEMLDNFFKTYVKDIPENRPYYDNIYKSLTEIYQRNVTNTTVKNATIYDIMKNNSIVNSFFIPKKDLIGLLHKSNMRFKQKLSKNNKKHKESLSNIISELKDYLKNLKE